LSREVVLKVKELSLRGAGSNDQISEQKSLIRTMGDIWDIAIIGAGAAGLAAAIFAGETARAAEQSRKIALLDSAKRIGAKILVSGGGRCNVTHEAIQPDDFNGSRHIVRNVLAAFDEKATVRWFASLGVSLKREETGKLFPVSDSARTVLEALLRRCAELGISVLTQHRVQGLAFLPGDVGARHAVPLQEGQPQRAAPTMSMFLVHHEQGALRARRVIMATGGRSLPRTGSDGSGWEIVRRLGHTVTDTYPALVPLVLRDDMFHAALSGVSLQVELSTFANGKRIDRRVGSLLWTHFGVSGPVVLDASRHWIVAKASGQATELRCNFFPERSFEEVEKLLIETATTRPRVSVGKILEEHFPERFVVALLRWAGIDPATVLSQLPRAQRRTLVHALTHFSLPIVCERGWNFAEVTAGGVPLQEIDYRTMASRKAPGLYLIGEFNFQWAWATGYLAGRAATVG
jgi:predicted Rossmann fold flavoprotein